MAALPNDGFVFPGMRSRVLFGAGRVAETRVEIERLGRSRVLVLSTAGQKTKAETLARDLGALAVGVFAEATMHTPIEVTERAVAAYAAARADCVVAIGGGSTTGLGKAIALRTGADQVVIPTTYAGSEMTDVLGETRAGEKTTRRDAAILPETVIYDVELTLGLPVAISVTSGLNALAHAIEGLYAPDCNPMITLMASEAIVCLARALPDIVGDPADRAARTTALRGAWLCGAVLGGSSMSLHHKLCHVLGGSFGLPHAETHAVMLPHTAGFNAPAAAEKLAPAHTVFGNSLGAGLYDFAARLGAPSSLQVLGLAESDLDRAADLAVKSPYANPRPFDRTDIRALLQEAWEGRRPGV